MDKKKYSSNSQDHAFYQAWRFLKTMLFKSGEVMFHAQIFPIMISFIILSVFLLSYRMKSTELDYKISSLSQKIEKEQNLNRDLLAEKAKLLSVKRLNGLAQKFELSLPGKNQVILLP